MTCSLCGRAGGPDFDWREMLCATCSLEAEMESAGDVPELRTGGKR